MKIKLDDVLLFILTLSHTDLDILQNRITYLKTKADKNVDNYNNSNLINYYNTLTKTLEKRAMKTIPYNLFKKNPGHKNFKILITTFESWLEKQIKLTLLEKLTFFKYYLSKTITYLDQDWIKQPNTPKNIINLDFNIFVSTFSSQFPGYLENKLSYVPISKIVGRSIGKL